jgi:S1-C subfamily serine protease
VEGVLCGTGAAAAGLVAGDVITGAAGQPVTSPEALTAIIDHYRPGTVVDVSWVGTSGVHHRRLVRLDVAPAA